MNFWEKYGTLVAVSLCGVSLIPSASMVNAQEEPEANQDKKAPETRKDTAISWKEVQRAPYYKDEEVSPQTETFGPEKPAEEVQAAAAVQTEEAEAPAVQEAAETAYAEETAQPYVPEQTAVFASDYAVPEVQPVYAEEQPAYIYEETAVYEPVQQTAVQETVYVQEEEAPAFVQEAEPAPAAQEAVYVQEEEASAPDQEAQPAPAAEQPAAEVPAEEAAESYDDLNKRIASSALQLVGTTDGMQCTEVVQMALSQAGVEDAMSMWPDEYADFYGCYTDTPAAGNLVFYDNGGQGTDHIAIYIGDGQAVHGNFISGGESRTVVYSVNVEGAGTPQYIQVLR